MISTTFRKIIIKAITIMVQEPVDVGNEDP